MVQQEGDVVPDTGPPVRSSTAIRRPHRVTAEVGAYLERLIRTELSPGDRLPAERSLADRLDVSRGSVRDALRDLEQRRVVERRPGRGTTVLAPGDPSRALAAWTGTRTADGPTDEDLEQLHVAELRLVVEPQIAGLAAARATESDLVQLEATLAASHAGLSPTESLELDVLFHDQLAHACRNPLLAALTARTAEWSREVRRRSHATRAGRRTSVQGHRALLEAVAAGDDDAAVAAMVAHLGDVARLVAGR